MSAALAEVFPVGEMLADELEAREWSQADFAEILGRPAQFVSEIVSGKKEITRESAMQIAAALGTSPEMWLKMQDRYYLWRQSKDERSQDALRDVRLRARLNDLAPIGIMRKRGLIVGATPAQQEIELKELYRITDIKDDPKLLLAARRSQFHKKISNTQLAWVACVRRKAETLNASSYKPEQLHDLASQLTRITKSPSTLPALPDMFAEVGVRLTFVEAFPGSRMDGCSLVDEGTHVIGVSGRGKRLDKFLFTLLHEVAHVLKGHLNNGQIVVVDERSESPTLEIEEEADELAASWVLPKKLGRIPDRISQEWINRTAADQGVHPIVLIGRLQNDNIVPWSTTLVRNAQTVLAELRLW